MKHLTTLLLLAGGLAFASAPAEAQAPARPSQPLVVTAQNVTAQQAGRAADVLPGDTVRYQLRFTNSQAVAVRNLVFDNPVPNGLRYVGATATANRPDVSVAYSIDGGRTYSAEPTVQRVVDGRRVVVPAPAEMFTHIRWTVQGQLLPGAQVTAEFRAQLAARGQDQSAPPRRGA
jgi:uncharacterized repeat protein (TIGR01451 family)